MTKPLWPHQERGIEEIKKLILAGEKRNCLTSPTGGGKSRIIEELILWGVKQGWQVSLYTHRQLLRDQISRSLHTSGIDHGMNASGFAQEPWKNVHVCMSQTVMSRLRNGGELHDSQLVIVDECHDQARGGCEGLLNKHIEAGAALVGVTATPLDIGHLYQNLVVAGLNSELRECGAHVWCRCFEPTVPDIHRELRRMKTGEFQQGDVVKAVMTPVIFGHVLTHWKKLNPYARPTILFAPGVKESIWFMDQFKRVGVKTAHICGESVIVDGEEMKSNRETRQQVLEDVAKGEIKVVCNRFVLREGVDCLDSKTEVLCSSGWKNFDEIVPGEEIPTLNVETGLIEPDTVKRTVRRTVKQGEQMLTIKSQHTDIRVTEGHSLYLKIGEGNWGLKKPTVKMSAVDFFNRRDASYQIPVSAEMVDGVHSEVPLTDDELKFIAWVMTDGHIGKTGTITICQTKHFRHEIREILRRLEFDFKEHVKVPAGGFANSKPTTLFSICKGVRGGKLARNGWWGLREYISKDSLDSLMGMSRRQFKLFYDELMKGNGQTSGLSGNRTGVYWTRYKKHRDQIMQLAVTRGFAVHSGEGKTKSGLTMYRVHIRDKKWICSRRSDRRSAVVEMNDSVPGELVWCVTTGNGTIITRRNGCVSILGNCPSLYHGILATCMGSPVSFLQSVGRILRSHPSLDHVILQDHGGNVHRHGSPNENREWDMGKTASEVCSEHKQKLEENPDLQPIVCPECGHIRKGGPQCPSCLFQHTKSIRRVIQLDGSLVEVSEGAKKKAKPPESDEAMWKKLYYVGKHKGWTFNKAAAIFKKERGRWPAGIGLTPKSKDDWCREIGSLSYGSMH